MPRVLVILEVSQKQAFIFGSRLLRENIRRSELIRYVTEPTYFEREAGDLFNKDENQVYTGGGHTVLQFNTMEQATAFVRRITQRTLELYPALALFAACIAYDETLSPGENLMRLSQKLEIKKARRQAGFRWLDIGVEKHGSQSFVLPAEERQTPPAGWTLTENINRLAGAPSDAESEEGKNDRDNFIAVIHIDGNAMGKRVQAIYEEYGEDWALCCEALKEFSESVDRQFEKAYQDTAKEIARMLEKDEKWVGRVLPMRRIIGAGDDLCFVTAGNIGLQCAASVLKKLAAEKNAVDEKAYPACAGVVLVHTKYPFRVAYDLSEALCSNAKKYGAAFAPDGSLSLLDWHIEFGQMKGSLREIRADYRAEDGTALTLRPLLVETPAANCKNRPAREHEYERFAAQVQQLRAHQMGTARSKVKQLRGSLRQGMWEARLAMVSMQFDKRMIDAAFFTDDLSDGKTERCCTCFDAIEIMDHFYEAAKGGSGK